MTAKETASHYSPCQFKFAFDVSNQSPLAWCEYFGWKDEFDMLNAFCKKHLKQEELAFSSVDYSGAKCVVIFEAYCEAGKFKHYYNKALSLLQKLSNAPECNPCPVIFNNMLETLTEHDIVIYENESDMKVFDEYNLITHGHRRYEEHISEVSSA